MRPERNKAVVEPKLVNKITHGRRQYTTALHTRQVVDACDNYIVAN